MRPLGRHITDDLRDLADAVERISQRFGWTSPAVDRDLTGAPGPIANSHDAWPTWQPASTRSATEQPDSPPMCAP